MKVYDCFLFFNELDLLELRLNELDDVVDVFVLIECTKTFSFKDKPLYFLENRDKFARFLHKIKHVIVDDTPNLPIDPSKGHNYHHIEHFQRACIDRGVSDCDAEDLIIISDVDEIFRPENIQQAIKLLQKQKLVGFEQLFFYYYLNGLCVQNGRAAPWNGPVACLKRDYCGAQKLRDDRGSSQPERIHNAGWHFSYLGGPDKIIQKIESYAHREWDNDRIKDKQRLEQMIAVGSDIFERPNRPHQVYVPIDDGFPLYLRSNIERFEHLIKK